MCVCDDVCVVYVCGTCVYVMCVWYMYVCVVYVSGTCVLYKFLLRSLKAQKNMDVSFQKLRILKMSLENRLEEFPKLAESIQGEEDNGDQVPPILPRPAQLTGTFYIKLLGVEGLLDLYTLRQLTSDVDSSKGNSPPRAFSARNAKHFMTLPTPNHREKEREKEKEKERERSMTTEEEVLGGSGTWYRKGSKHLKNKNAALQKQHSLDHIDEPSG